ncbi:MAG: NF038122 family metalloprotease [Planctomycetota bacterium]
MRFAFQSTGNSHADAAIKRATDRWASEFTDDITVNLEFEFTFMAADVFAGTASNMISRDYGTFWTAIGNDASSADDATMFNSLPVGSSFSVYINRTSEAGGANHEIPYLDNDGGANNTTVSLTSANGKALGLVSGNDGTLDATIQFNNTYNWDYNPDDGISGSSLDFLGIATHEIGHALGFISGVDVLGSQESGGVGGGGTDPGYSSDNTYAQVSSLDFLRHSQDSVDAGADLDWTADPRDKFFSIDGGQSPAAGGLSHWSTSVNYGDGQQASHWKDGQNLGIMDPTAEQGFIYDLSGNDIRAFDVIGFNLSDGNISVPEPSSIMLGWLVLIPLMKRRRSA